MGNNAFVTVMLLGVSAFFFRGAWRFAFRYQEELDHPVHGKGAAWQALSLQDHGHVGIVLHIVVGGLIVLAALTLGWRFVTRFPATILMPDRLWLHPSFGRQPIFYANIVGVSLDRMSKRQIALVVLTEDAVDRNWVFWTNWGSPCQLAIREAVVDCSLYDLARFRDRLAGNADQARSENRSSS